MHSALLQNSILSANKTGHQHTKKAALLMESGERGAGANGHVKASCPCICSKNQYKTRTNRLVRLRLNRTKASRRSGTDLLRSGPPLDDIFAGETTFFFRGEEAEREVWEDCLQKDDHLGGLDLSVGLGGPFWTLTRASLPFTNQLFS